MPGYRGPKKLDEALSAFHLERGADAVFHREGLRADSEYRDLGLSAATGGKLGVKHIRAIGPFGEPTGWHWHDVIARSEDFEVLELNVPAEYGTFDLPKGGG